MTSDIQCCLSPEDTDSVVLALGGDTESSSPPFSVGFCVKKETDVDDGLSCDYASTVFLDKMDGLHLLKGTYPAVSYVRQSPQRKCWETASERFSSKREFAEWVVEQARDYALEITQSLWVRDALLAASGFKYEVEVTKIQEELERSLESCEQQCCEEVTMQIEDFRAELLSVVDKLFMLDYLLEASADASRLPSTSESSGAAFENPHARIGLLRRDIHLWRAIPPETQVLLELPLRLKNQMKCLVSVFHEDYRSKRKDQLGDILTQMTLKAKRLSTCATKSTRARCSVMKMVSAKSMCF